MYTLNAVLFSAKLLPFFYKAGSSCFCVKRLVLPYLFYVIVFKLSTHVIPVCVIAMKKAVEKNRHVIFPHQIKK